MGVVTLFCVDVTMIPVNGIGVEGVKVLVPALKSLSQLTSLNLNYKQYDVAGIEALKNS